MARFRSAAGALALIIVAGGAAPSAGDAAPAAQALMGTVGPAFTIALRTSSGTVVQTLRAGTYTIRIRDRSAIHNFHLFGPGVNKRTSIQGTGATVWKVTLVRGVYRYQCDPHRTIMRGSLRVA